MAFSLHTFADSEFMYVCACGALKWSLINTFITNCTNYIFPHTTDLKLKMSRIKQQICALQRIIVMISTNS